MPTSNWQNISYSIGLIREWMPESVLDVGCGFGRWGALCREFLDVWEGRPYPHQWSVRIDGVEGFPRYITDAHRTFYSNLYLEDVREVLPKLGTYDLVILGDVLEHFEKEEGFRILSQICEHLSEKGKILVNIPLGPDWPQDDAYGNDLERHRSEWTATDFETVGGEAELFEDYRKRPFATVVLNRASKEALDRKANQAGMRLAFVTHEYPIKDKDESMGGIAAYVLTVTGALASRGHDVHVVTRSCEEMPADWERSGVSVHHVSVGAPNAKDPKELKEYGRAVARRLADLGREKPFDVVEFADWAGEGWAYQPPPGTVTMVRLHGPSFILRSFEYDDGSAAERQVDEIERWATERADLITAPSKEIVRRIEGNWAIRRASPEVLPNPVDLDRFPVSACTAKESSPVVLSVNRLTPIKGGDVLIRAMARVSKQIPDAMLRLVGRCGTFDGRNATEHLLELADKVGLARDRIEFVSYKPREILHEEYSQASVCVNPSRFESFSYTSVEAMACGRPTILSTGQGIAGHLNDGEDCILVPPDKPDELGTEILRVLKSQDLRNRLSENGRKAVEERFDVDRFVREYEVLCKKAVKSKRLRPSVVPQKINLAILTHNALEHTQRCVESLLKKTHRPFNLFILDNASTDGTPAWLANLNDPRVRVELSDQNHGVPGGRNRLLRRILESVPEDGTVAFLDNDVTVEESWEEPFLEILDRRSEVGIVGATGHPIEIVGDERRLLASPLDGGTVDAVSGFAFWVRARVAQEVGLFDEALGLFWHEDDDYCLRAIGLGHEVYAVSAPALHHAEHQSGAAVSESSEERSRKNQAYLVQKWIRLGLIDDSGWILHPRSIIRADGPVMTRLAQMQGRTRIPREEVCSALWHLDRLLYSRDAQREHQERQAPVSQTLLDLLAVNVALARSLGHQLLGTKLGAIETVLRGRRYSVQARQEIDVQFLSTEQEGVTYSKVCSSRDWNSPSWVEGVADVLGDENSLNYYQRHRQTWEYGQILFGLKSLDCLRSDKRGLAVGAGKEMLMWKIADRVGSLEAIDFYDDRSKQLFDVPVDLPENPEAYAPEGASLENFRVRRMDGRSLSHDDESFDFAYAASVIQHCGGREGSRRMLQEMARVVKPGGVIAVSSDVILNSAIDHSRPRLSEVEDFFSDFNDMKMIGAFGRDLNDETMEAFADCPANEGRRPHFLHRCGSSILTSMVIFLEKQGARVEPGFQSGEMDGTRNGEPDAREAVGARSTGIKAPASRFDGGDRKRIGVDIRTLYYANSVSRGIGHYTVNHLVALSEARPQWEFVCFGEGDAPAALRPLLGLGNVSYADLGSYAPGELDLVHLPDPMNLSFGFDSPFRVFHDSRMTALFHDLIPLRFYWSTWTDDLRAVYHARLEQLRKSDAMILTNSEFTKLDVVNTLTLPEERVRCVLAGLNQSRRERPQSKNVSMEAIREKLGIQGPFFLHVGAVDSHKNFETVLEAFSVVRERHNVFLVVVGRLDADLAKYARLSKKAPLLRNVVFPGFVSREDLEVLYAEACALVFLSKYEGFGFPALEAMAEGCPVIGSRAASLPEVIGPSSLLVEAHDVLGAARVMEDMLLDPEKRRLERQRCLQRAPQFSWEQTAKRTLSVWENMLSSGPNGGATWVANGAKGRTPSPVSKERCVVWQAPLFDPSGYGEEARSFALGLEGAREIVHGIPLFWSQQRARLRPDDQRRLRAMVSRAPDPRARAIHVFHAFPTMFHPLPYVHANVGRTIFETDRIPENWVDHCKKMDEIWVPTDFNLETFARSGVPESLLKKVPAFVDTDFFTPEVPPMSLSGRRGFNFLSIFDWTLRKGWDVLLSAYIEEFAEEEDVCLFLRVSSSLGWSQKKIAEMIEVYVRKTMGRDPDHIPELVVLPDFLTQSDMPSLYTACDAFVMPSRGEGWGRPYMEAMACGLPVIGTSWSGNLEYMNRENSFLIDHTVVDVPEVAVKEANWFKGHRWANPSKGHLRQLMREVVENRERGRQVGKRARSDVAGPFGREMALKSLRERLDALS